MGHGGGASCAPENQLDPKAQLANGADGLLKDHGLYRARSRQSGSNRTNRAKPRALHMHNPPARQHYVPQFYLRNWTREPNGELWRCARMPRGNLHDQSSSPKATAFEKDLYTLSSATPIVPAAAPYTIEEEFFKELDNDAAGALATLLSGGVSALDNAGRKAWALFLNSLLERAPDHLRRLDAKAQAIVDQSYDRLQAGSDPEGRERFSRIMNEDARTATARNYVRLGMMERIKDPVTIAGLADSRWLIVNNTNPDFEFITTDSPVVINYGSAGPGLDVLAISLSPQRLFLLHPTSWGKDTEYHETLGLLAFAHNLLLLDRPCTYIYSRSKLQDGDIVKLRKAVEISLKRIL